MLRTVCNTSTWLATSRCALTSTASAGVGVSSVAATADGAADRVPDGRRGRVVGTGTDRSSMCSSTPSSHSSHVHTSGVAAAAAGDADAGGRRTTAVISSSASSSSSGSRSRNVTPAASRAKSINTESVEHDGDKREEAEGGGGDHTGPAAGRGRRDTTPPAAPGSWSAGRGGASGGSGRGSGGGRATRESDGGSGGDAATGRGLSNDETDEVDDQPEGALGIHGGEDGPQRGEDAGQSGVSTGGANILVRVARRAPRGRGGVGLGRGVPHGKRQDVKWQDVDVALLPHRYGTDALPT